MIRYIEAIYKHSPVLVQNVICSLYGLQLYWERYGGSGKYFYEELNKTQYWSQQKLRNLQTHLLKRILHHSISYVPYYRESLNIKRDEIDDICSADVLEQLPILEKETLRKHSAQFKSGWFKGKRLIKVGTSGTTGTPLTILLSHEARQKNYAFFARSKQWAGVPGFARSLTLAGRTIVPAEQQHPPFWRKNVFLNNELMSSYHLSEANVKYYVGEIMRIKPVFIDSYPSSISFIADYMLRKGINYSKVGAIITSAETLMDHQREKIEKAFGCKVYDQYGSAEQVVFACQCESGSYHVNPEYGYLEVLDGKNRRVKVGELGDLVCTGFTNLAMPLIRYKIGDRGIMGSQLCSCGRSFPVITRIFGRNDDFLITPDGRYIGSLDPIFKGMTSTIREAQLVQMSKDFVLVRIVRGSGYRDEHGTYIIEELHKRIGPGMHYRIEFFDSIPRKGAGKYRAVICNIDKNERAKGGEL